MPEVVEVVQVELVVEPVEPVVVELHQQVFQQETEQLILEVEVAADARDAAQRDRQAL